MGLTHSANRMPTEGEHNTYQHAGKIHRLGVPPSKPFCEVWQDQIAYNRNKRK